MRRIHIFILILSISIFSVPTTHAQQVNNLYFLENAPVRHYLNPAFQPLSGFYLGFPVLGYTQFGVGNNSFTLSSLATPKLDVFQSLKQTTNLHSDIQFNILDFGFRNKDAYWSFGITEKVNIQVGLPKHLFELMMFGAAREVNGEVQYENNIFDLKTLSLGAQAYTEAALGYSKLLNEKWSVGAKLKFLYGTGNLSARFDNFELVTGVDQWRIKANGILNISSPIKIKIVDDSLSYSLPSAVTDYAKPYGMGGAIDLGFTYKPLSFLTIGLAMNDLGFIRWNKNVNQIGFGMDYTFNGVDTLTTNDLFNGINTNALVDTIASNFNKAKDINNDTKAYFTNISPRINASAEIGILKNSISLGLLSSTQIINSIVYQDITTSLNLRPINWFNLALSYSLFNGRTSNIGAGIGMRIGMFNTFVTADYVPVNYTRFPISVFDPNSSDIIPLPYKTDRVNLALGFNIVFGNKQDKDKDGVSNRIDKCPDTPHGVIVDKKGCPIDTDGDRVYDFLDKCPDTPKEAYSNIDADGCPIDTDGDGVFDYLDKCPGTVPAAYGKVDENGCPKDTDKDGIVDYLDKCEATPEGVMVDSLGCPLDEDGDNVPDYLDKCPATPIEARGLIDSVGCPIDKDIDGVYDYLDLCPNTPAEARGNVDKNGCPKDTDQDGVADYLDKCPDTPLEAKGTVDANGCPRDTDGDGVLDYLDNCPRLAGVASNKGCPEIKKEVRMLFQKALQGIQFETAKWIIKPVSFKILDDVAKVLAENPTYLVEIQGHTDNVGKKAANQLLSENRAKAVRDYLIKKGIDEKRMTSNGYGDTKPVLPNTNAKNKAKNRRVEFVVSFEEVKIVEEEL